MLIIVEGPTGSGRATAVAAAVGSPVVALDGAVVEQRVIDAALRALRREAFLSGSVPVLEDVERLVVDDAARAELGRNDDVFVARHDAGAPAAELVDEPRAVTRSGAPGRVRNTAVGPSRSD